MQTMVLDSASSSPRNRQQNNQIPHQKLVGPDKSSALEPHRDSPSSPRSTSAQDSPQQLSRPLTPPECLVLSVRFNQDFGCFACGTQTGFRVFNCHPFRETFRREFDGSGIGLVEMLFRCNIVAIVGGGKAPRYSPNKVMIWDDHQGRCIGELTFRSEVRAVRLRRNAVIVILEHKVYVYNFADLHLIHSIETLANPKGLCVISCVTNSWVLVCPGQRRGEVHVELYSLKKTKYIQAHDSALACLGLTLDGTLLATASTKGTLIRIFNTQDCTKLQELRRGTDRAEIYSIAFSPGAHWLVVSSDKGTVHVFGLKAPEETKAGDGMGLNGSLMMAGSALLSFATSNAGSSLSFMKGVLPKYFSSEWSFAQFRVPDDAYAMAAFGAEKNSVILVCTNGSFYKCSFDPIHGGEMVQRQYEKFMTRE